MKSLINESTQQFTFVNGVRVLFVFHRVSDRLTPAECNFAIFANEIEATANGGVLSASDNRCVRERGRSETGHNHKRHV